LISFDPLEVEGIVYYTRAELEALIESDAGGFSAWFVQLLRWYVEKPSELDVIETFTNERLLLLTKNQNC
jgi:hypothetical protein